MSQLYLVETDRAKAEAAAKIGKRTFGQGNASQPYEILYYCDDETWVQAVGGFRFAPSDYFIEELA